MSLFLGSHDLLASGPHERDRAATTVPVTNINSPKPSKAIWFNYLAGWRGSKKKTAGMEIQQRHLQVAKIATSQQPFGRRKDDRRHVGLVAQPKFSRHGHEDLEQTLRIDNGIMNLDIRDGKQQSFHTIHASLRTCVASNRDKLSNGPAESGAC